MPFNKIGHRVIIRRTSEKFLVPASTPVYIAHGNNGQNMFDRHPSPFVGTRDSPTEPAKLIADVVQKPLSCVSRTLLPDGSRNPESMPYGMSCGASVNSTPRARSCS